MSNKIWLIDVGARGGVDKRWEPFHNMLEAIAFEPDPQECVALNSIQYPYSIRFLPVALGAHHGEKATLFVCRQSGCSSLLRPNKELCKNYRYKESMEVIGEQPIIMSHMGTACGNFQPDVIKIDTQGTELDILRGSGALLDSALAIELEVEFVPQYIGQPH